MNEQPAETNQAADESAACSDEEIVRSSSSADQLFVMALLMIVL